MQIYVDYRNLVQKLCHEYLNKTCLVHFGTALVERNPVFCGVKLVFLIFLTEVTPKSGFGVVTDFDKSSWTLEKLTLKKPFICSRKISEHVCDRSPKENINHFIPVFPLFQTLNNFISQYVVIYKVHWRRHRGSCHGIETHVFVQLIVNDIWFAIGVRKWIDQKQEASLALKNTQVVPNYCNKYGLLFCCKLSNVICLIDEIEKWITYRTSNIPSLSKWD